MAAAWTEMQQQIRNKEKFGIFNPTKEQRRLLCKRDGEVLSGSDGSDSDGPGSNSNNSQNVSTHVM